jgi:lantibiotic modifying enzyme
MARLAARACLDDPRMDLEVDLALGSTRERGFGMNHSLCHGDLGNVELLLQADRAAGDGCWQAEVARRAGMVLAGIRRRG